jgi:hypothetical protein
LSLPADLVNVIFGFARDMSIAENSDYIVSGSINKKAIVGMRRVILFFWSSF